MPPTPQKKLPKNYQIIARPPQKLTQKIKKHEIDASGVDFMFFDFLGQFLIFGAQTTAPRAPQGPPKAPPREGAWG